MKMIKKLLGFLSLVLLYVIVKEFLSLYAFAKSVHPWFGYGMIGLILAFTTYFVFIPLFQIFKMPRTLSPTTKRNRSPQLVQKRLKQFRSNPYIKESGFDFVEITWDEEGYRKVIQHLNPQAEQIRKKYVSQLFYSTAIVQNGFLDGLLILSSSINLVKEIFVLYHGRVANRELLRIAKLVYYSMAIGGSEGVEYATDEIFSKLTSKGIKSIPFASKILGSVADGFVNAALLTRISLITENYCKTIYLESEKYLYPSIKSVISATKIITSDIIERISNELKKMVKDRSTEIMLMTVNPVGYVIGKSLGRIAENVDNLTLQQRHLIRETSLIAHNPFHYGFGRLFESLKKKRYAKS